MKTTALLLAVLLLAACTGATPPALTPGTPAAPTDPPVASPPVASPPAATPALPTPPPLETFPPFEGDLPQELMELLVDEAAVLAEVNLGDVRVVRAEAVTWSDASLGCPEDDQMYAQVLTDGYWVVLEAGGQEYDFRLAEDGPPRLCPEGQGEPPAEGLPD